MKDTQKRFLGAVLAASSVVGIVAPSVTAMATVQDDEEKATAEELRAAIKEYTGKLEENPIFANYHRVEYAADRLAKYDAVEAEAAKQAIIKYADKVYTTEVKTILDKMGEFASTKSMKVYGELVNTDINAMKNKEDSQYLMGRLTVWGTDFIFAADTNYSKATDAIIAVGKLVNAGKYEEAGKLVPAAKEAIKNIKTYEVNGAYLEAQLKEYEDIIAEKANLKVVSAEAINAKEIKVVFNRELDEDSAEAQNNYKLYVGGDATENKVTKFESSLQDDNKTVILQLNDKDKNYKKLENGQSYKVEVKDVLDVKGKKVENYNGSFSIFNDKTAPSLVNTEYTGSTLKLTFDEPLDRSSLPTVKVDNTTLSGTKTFSTDAGEYELTIDLGKDSKAQDLGKHAVKISGTKDYADNTADMITTEYTATEENEKPVVKSIEADSKNEFIVKFNTNVEALDEDGSNFEIKKGNHKFQNVTVTAETETDEKDKVINKKDEFKITVNDDANNDLYDDNETKIELSVKVKDVKGTNSKVGDDFTGKVTLEKDEIAPVVNEALNRVDGKDTLVVYFNEDLKEQDAEKGKITVVRDGFKEEVIEATAKDKQLRISLDNTTELKTGEYKITLEKGTVEDKDGNKNEATSTRLSYTNDNAEELGVNKKLVDVEPNTKLSKNVLTVAFANEDGKIKMDKESALDLSNYMIDGTKLSDSMYAGTSIAFNDENKKDTVEIILARGTIDEKTSEKDFKLSKDLKSDKGNYITDGKDKEHSEKITLHDDTNPEMNKIEFIKKESGNTSTNVLRVKFTEAIQQNEQDPGKDEEIQRNIADDFIVRDANGNKIDIAEVKVDDETNAKDHDTIVIRLKNDISVNKILTVEATDNKDDNKTGIDLIDYSKLVNKMETGKMNTSDKETNKEVYNFANKLVNALDDAKDAVKTAEENQEKAVKAIETAKENQEKAVKAVEVEKAAQAEAVKSVKDEKTAQAEAVRVLEAAKALDDSEPTKKDQVKAAETAKDEADAKVLAAETAKGKADAKVLEAETAKTQADTKVVEAKEALKQAEDALKELNK